MEWIESKAVIILAVLSGLLFLVAVGLYAYDMHLTANLAKATATISELTLANQNFKEAADQQNAEIDKWRKLAADAEAAATKAMADAANAAKLNAQKAAAILGYKGSGNDCQASDELFSAYLSGDLK